MRDSKLAPILQWLGDPEWLKFLGVDLHYQPRDWDNIVERLTLVSNKGVVVIEETNKDFFQSSSFFYHSKGWELIPLHKVKSKILADLGLDSHPFNILNP